MSRFSSRFVFAVVAALAAAAPAAAQDATARYVVVFDAVWSESTHQVPPGPHFSPLAGISHDAGVVFWEEGGIATQGIEDMAELGLTTALEAEFAAAIGAGTAHAIALGGGADSPGRTAAALEVTLAHPLATLVSMIAPSPDWFVGVSGVPLFAAGDWLGEVVVELHPYDAGTDAGTTFLAADADVTPHVPITELTGTPFENAPPLGTFRFLRVASYPTCLDGIDDDADGRVDFPDDPGCTDWDDTDEQEASLPCDNGVDDDGDGSVDLADIGCRDPGWSTESPECSDGINNDPGQDDDIDFDGGASQNGGVPLADSDTNCNTAWRNAERRRSGCGLGAEIAPLLLAVAAWGRRRTTR